MDRLQQIEDELTIIDCELHELNSRKSKLSKERREIIQSTCEHIFEYTGYSELGEDDIFKDETICSKCGLTKWE
jgi:hypothetical protein